MTFIVSFCYTLGCSLRYKMALYPQFKGINSQVAEQKNSRLADIKPQLSYMNPKIFLQPAQLFLSHHNKSRRASLTATNN